MSKSIYEEAIGQLLKIQGRLSTNYDKFLEVKQALELAIKQEKLLELYRKHYKLVPFMPGLGDNAKTVIDNSRKIEQIEKELENEQ